MKSDVKGQASQSLVSDQPDKPPAAHESAEVPNEERTRYLKALEATKKGLEPRPFFDLDV